MNEPCSTERWTPFAANSQNLIVELEERHHPGITKQVFDLLASFGYQGLFLWDGKMLPHKTFDPAIHRAVFVTVGPWVFTRGTLYSAPTKRS